MPTSRHSRGPVEKHKTTQTPRRDHGAPPGMQQTMSQSDRCKNKLTKTYEYPPANGQVLVFMRYKADMDRRMRNCIIRMKSRIKQPGTEGCCIGVTHDKVQVLETTAQSDWDPRSDYRLAVFLFPSEEKARRWYFTEPELKQPDFLPPSDGVQLFALNLRYMPRLGGKLTFNWTEMHNVRSKSFLQHEVVNKTAQLLDEAQVNHGIIFMQDPGSPTQLYRLKESWIPHNADAYCVVHVYEDEAKFTSIYGGQNYAELRGKRGEVCDSVSLLFTINPDVTGPPSSA